MERLGQRAKEIAPTGLLVLLWLITTVVAIGWLLGWNLPLEPEAALALLGSISSAVTVIVARYAKLVEKKQRDLEDERYSLSYALAYGYVNNFVEPTITELLNEPSRSEEKPQLYVYIPETLSELYPRAISRTLAKIRGLGYSTEIVKMEFEHGRARDIMTVLKEPGKDIRYFDFPNTLLTLVSLVEYKMAKQPDSFSEEAKDALGKVYIDAFKTALQNMIQQKGLSEYVWFTDRNLRFLEQG